MLDYVTHFNSLCLRSSVHVGIKNAVMMVEERNSCIKNSFIILVLFMATIVLRVVNKHIRVALKKVSFDIMKMLIEN